PPILESRNARRQQEKADQEKAELQERLQEEAERRKAMQAELKAMQERRRLARGVALFALTTLALMVLFGIWFSYNWVRSVEKELQQAEFIVSGEAFHAGVEAYQSLLDKPIKVSVLRRVAGKELADELAKVRVLHALYDTIVTANMIKGDSLFFRDRFSEALTDYREAYEAMNNYTRLNDYVRIDPTPTDTVWRIQRKHIKNRYDDLYQRRVFALNAIIAQFKIKQRAAEEFVEAGVWAQALRLFREMQALLPQHEEDLERLQIEMSLNQNPVDYIDREIQKCRGTLFGR
ncbi:MAG: hypothetical protein JNK89_08445, partial [Saprospiraceae bacterium]|nr:hypothetical protein [Saprospiraceae bacterium]